jgi:hypothetical protein
MDRIKTTSPNPVNPVILSAFFESRYRAGALLFTLRVTWLTNLCQRQCQGNAVTFSCN